MVYAHLYSKLRLTHDSKGRFYVQFYFAGKRFRYSNGEAIGGYIKPNSAHGAVAQEHQWKNQFFQFIKHHISTLNHKAIRHCAASMQDQKFSTNHNPFH